MNYVYLYKGILFYESDKIENLTFLIEKLRKIETSYFKLNIDEKLIIYYKKF